MRALSANANIRACFDRVMWFDIASHNPGLNHGSGFWVFATDSSDSDYWLTVDLRWSFVKKHRELLFLWFVLFVFLVGLGQGENRSLLRRKPRKTEALDVMVLVVLALLKFLKRFRIHVLLDRVIRFALC